MTPAPWTDHWFPLAFRRDLEAGRIERVHAGARAVALYLDGEGRPAALLDRCPHRAARLSDGRMAPDGTVECLYHGWRFDRDGACVEAPQQPAGQPIPPKGCARPVDLVVEQGIVWAWGGAPGAGAQVVRPTVPVLDELELHTIDFAMDLPYGQDFFVENVLDVAHIHVAHSGTRGGGHRSLAGPLEFEVEDHGAVGFTSAVRTSGLDAGQRTEGLQGARVEFRAPNLVHYESDFGTDGRVSGLALYSIPLGPERCRMLYRAYGNLWTEEDLARPRWMEHLNQCHLLEEDMAVVRGQALEMDGGDETLADMWLPLRTSDRLVLAYREWIERFVPERPGAVGLRTPGARGLLAEDAAMDRWTLHTSQCSDCRAALERQRRGAALHRSLGLGALALAAVVPFPFSLAPAAGAACAYVAARRTERLARDLTLHGGDAASAAGSR